MGYRPFELITFHGAIFDMKSSVSIFIHTKINPREILPVAILVH